MYLGPARSGEKLNPKRERDGGELRGERGQQAAPAGSVEKRKGCPVQGASPGQAKAHRKLVQKAQKADEVISFIQKRDRARKLAFLLLASSTPGEPGRPCSYPPPSRPEK